jgi:hypothetical protein
MQSRVTARSTEAAPTRDLISAESCARVALLVQVVAEQSEPDTSGSP